ncbi:MAG TPA: DUF2975 domain-containing protein [Methylocystis sp.]|nr:DUF2975 domain-containing protein [Methylocystis sp.]
MTNTFSLSAAEAPHDPRLETLRRRIGWICHALRLAALAYCLWVLGVHAQFWADESLVVSRFGHLGVDAAGVAAVQRLEGFGVSFAIWLLLAAACYSAWSLCSTYLAGRIFTRDAALWLRRVALFGLGAALVDIVTRPLVSLIVTAHKGAGQHVVSVFLRPEDLSTLMLLTTLLALAHIQKTAAEIADEHAQFV